MSQLRTPAGVSTDEQAVRSHQIAPLLGLVDIAPPFDQSSARPESMAAPITLAVVVISALVLAVAAALMTAFGA